MTIRRLRPAYSTEELATVYDHAYDHTRWPDHVQRVQATIDFIHTITTPVGRDYVVDLSCGDGAIVRGLHDVQVSFMGDLVDAPHVDVVGFIEDTIRDVQEAATLFVLSETLEHIDDPQQLLEEIRSRAHRIVLTTPLDEQNDGNPEHYWGWDTDGIHELLTTAGWRPDHYREWTPDMVDPYYTFQMWSAR